MSRQLRLTEEEFKSFVSRGQKAQASVTPENKFHARKTMVDGIEFDSKHEAEHYVILKRESGAGRIQELRLQQPLQVEINGHHVFTYYADFTYRDMTKVGRPKRYVDVKGYRKGAAYQLFRLKKGVIFAAMGIEIEEA